MNVQSLFEQVRLMQDRFQVVGRRFSLILQVTEEPDERYAIAEMMTWVALSMETLATIHSVLQQESVDQDLTTYQKSVESLNNDLTMVENRQKAQIEAFVDEDLSNIL